MAKKVAVILSGCGNRDGAEIHESVFCLLALDQEGHQVSSFAPDKPQAIVVNHYTGEKTKEARNCLVEAARIARGAIKPLSELKAENFDALVLPGGFGAALNLCTYAQEGENCSIDPILEKIILDFYRQGKPIGATCIAPVILAKVFQGKKTLTLTLGSAAACEPLHKMGMNAKPAKIDEIAADKVNKVYTTPAYMEPPHLSKMYQGILAMVREMGL